jgi:hypothetical protein
MLSEAFSFAYLFYCLWATLNKAGTKCFNQHKQQTPEQFVP